MFKSKYLFTFILTTFLILSITGAGVFLDDEWVSAQQLRQFGEGHQIVKNEGIYGYYENGTSGNYFNYRDNRLMYTMALPIISFPIYEIIKFSGDYFRLIVLGTWTLLGLLILLFLFATERITTKYFTVGTGVFLIFTIINILLYKDFPVNGNFIPSEVLAIVSTNIILFGLLSVILHKTIDTLYNNNQLKIFAFITVLSCTSLLFWVGTCKDHMLAILVGSLILYYLIQYNQTKSMTSLSFALFLTGLLTWVRIEFGVGMIVAIVSFLLIFHYEDLLSGKWVLSILFLIGTIPTWINNHLTTGSIFTHPFLIANAGFGSAGAEDELAASLISAGGSHPIEAIFHLLFSPQTGAIGLLILTPLILIVISAYIIKRVELDITDYLLLIITFGSSLYYIIKPLLYMSADLGIMPDMRYFIFFYTVSTLLSISLLSKIIPDLKYKRMVIYYILAVGLFIILFTTYSATLSDHGTYRDLNKIVNTVMCIVMGIGIIAVINDLRLNRHYLNYILPIMIAIPMAWQLVMIFIYHTSKVQAYPMFIPITEFIYNYIFGLIL